MKYRRTRASLLQRNIWKSVGVLIFALWCSVCIKLPIRRRFQGSGWFIFGLNNMPYIWPFMRLALFIGLEYPRLAVLARRQRYHSFAASFDYISSTKTSPKTHDTVQITHRHRPLWIDLLLSATSCSILMTQPRPWPGNATAFWERWSGMDWRMVQSHMKFSTDLMASAILLETALRTVFEIVSRTQWSQRASGSLKAFGL